MANKRNTNDRYNLIFCIDNNYYPLLKYVFKTFIKNNDPSKFNLYFVTDKSGDVELENRIRNKLLEISPEFNVFIKQFDPPEDFKNLVEGYSNILNKLIKKCRKEKMCTILGVPSKRMLEISKNVSNWSRFYISELFPEIKKGLYLDLDILFKGNIEELLNIDLEGNLVGACRVTTKNKPKLRQSEKMFMNNFDDELLKNINLDLKELNNFQYNCGVLYIDFDKFKEEEILKKIKFILKYMIDSGNILYLSGTNQIQWLVAPNFKVLPNRFNTILKWATTKARKSATILHFKGLITSHPPEEYIKSYKEIYYD